jgi:lipopolysaccharide export system ATP-binding protein
MSSLECKNLEKSYDSQKVVDDISINISSGEVIGLLGPNGAGKTTTFYMAVGLIKTDSGKILIDDMDITISPIHKRFEHGISYLPQEPSIFRDMTAIDNIKSVLATDKLLGKKEKQKTLDDLISKFNLESFLYTKESSFREGEGEG